MKPTPSERTGTPWQPLAVLVALGAGLTWAYWPALTAMAGKWAADPQYSHGFLVPLFAIYLLWHRREMLAAGPLRPSWACVPLLLLGIGMRLPAETLNFALEWFEGLSLVLTLAGLCLLLGGGPTLRWAWPSLLFLLFMLPLPFNVERALALELRWVATQFSTYVLQTLGFAAIAEGNTILLDTQSVGVAEACSGLSMLLTFIALAVAVVFLFDLSLLERGLILLSAVPIAVLANSVRIIVTAVFMEKWDADLAYQFFHNYAGWLMMVFALVVLYLEVALFRRLVVAMPPQTRPPTRPVPVKANA